jgi:DNA-binding protein YbaB
MFDSLKSMAGLAGVMKDLPKIKARMEEVKRGLADKRVEAETGGGAVRVVADGAMRIISVRVNQTLLAGLVNPTTSADLSMAEDLIAGAVNAALQKARETAERELAKAAEELNLPLPPGGLGGLLG